jgi:hypothetical protein
MARITSHPEIGGHANNSMHNLHMMRHSIGSGQGLAGLMSRGSHDSSGQGLDSRGQTPNTGSGGGLLSNRQLNSAANLRVDGYQTANPLTPRVELANLTDGQIPGTKSAQRFGMRMTMPKLPAVSEIV